MMLEIIVPADWIPDTNFRPFDLCTMVVVTGTPGEHLGPLGVISWYEVGIDDDGPDPRYNLGLSLGFGRLSERPGFRSGPGLRRPGGLTEP